ncbi:hypothetical protein HYPBUDRAFT_110114 [Hyphopichia burtonii NRRL Y-1933]|uniref:DM2 domain-containing protein n=1 Tax=Hyphopichia burtonii NRRL Y-1933 TaxID=984485 RepID=A0A1E4RHZ5_9ASCO|nr:hypothetical protein HYPBUDRAFT_110114 [Hyphopichia burtonii NRRL Y-1933]ODV66889.1 hypothetical protein HYPBUDRAFT_110114 [Hyphopichia burtonii NRRL Y-1933]
MPRTNTGPAPSISYSPTDTVIPPQLYDKVSDLEMYKKLQEAERQVDLLITKKGLDFQAIHAKSIQPSNFKNDTGILRVFVYNTCENQPWQRQLLQEQGQPVPDPTAAESLWTLRVEGRFISDENNSEQQNLKFSNFLSGLSIDLLPNSDYPDLQNSQLNLIEYRDETSQIPGINSLQAAQARQQFDGFDVKRPGVFNIKTKIALMVKDQSGKLKLSDEMAQFIGKKEATQQELVYLVWQYVLYKDLFKNRDSFPKVPAVSASSIANSNGISVNQNGEEEDLSIIESDEILKSLLKVDNFKFNDLYKLLQPHFRPREPIILDYEINTRQSSTLGEVVIDIPVELPASITRFQAEIIESNKKAFESMTKADSMIQSLNQRISLGIVSLQNANQREIFYRELSNDPVKFIEKWVESQAETLKALKSDEGYDEEVVRRSQYFKENEDLLKLKIDLMLGAQKY